MNRLIKKSEAVSYVLIAIAILIFLAIWPGNLIQSAYVSQSNEIMAMESDLVSVERNVTQMFVGEGGELSAVDLYVCNDMRGETITFRLYDASYTEIFNKFHVVDADQEFPGFVHIPVGYDLAKDQEYYFTLEGLTADMTVAYELRETSTSIVNGFMSYGGVEIQRYNVIIRYEYSNPFTWWQVLLSGMGLAAVVILLILANRKLFTKIWKDKEITVQRVLQFVVNPIIVVAGFVTVYSIFPGRKFGTGALNYAVYGGSTFLMMALLLYYINVPREKSTEYIDFSGLKRKLPDYAQAIAVAGMLWACYEYMNGLYEIHHAWAGCKQLFWAALIIITSFDKKELLNIWNAVWAVVGLVVCYLFAKPYIGIEEQGELYALGAYAIYAGGFVLLNLICVVVQAARKKRMPAKLNLAYFFPYAGLLVLLCAFRKSDWPVHMSFIVGVIFLRLLFWEKRERFVENYCNGIILHFLAMVLFSLWHRPYHKYIYYRYNMGYFTVTVTATFLTLALSAIVVKLFVKYRRTKALKDLFWECGLFGMAASYMLFTMSRTALFGVGVMGFAMVIFLALTEHEKGRWLKDIGQRIVILIVSVVLLLPITFTVTRIVPAVINDPVTFDYDHNVATIYKGAPSDSHNYIDVDEFLWRFGSKVLGLPEEGESSQNEGENTNANLADGIMMNADACLASTDSDNILSYMATDIILASADDEEDEDETIDISNGRIAVFKAYIADWNLTGHDDMNAEGTDAGHAHNMYLQVAHDQGLLVGIYYTLFVLGSMVYAFFYAKKHKENNVYTTLTPSLLVGFVCAGMVEWIFHACNMFGLSAMLVMLTMVFKKDAE